MKALVESPQQTLWSSMSCKCMNDDHGNEWPPIMIQVGRVYPWAALHVTSRDISMEMSRQPTKQKAHMYTYQQQFDVHSLETSLAAMRDYEI